MYFAVETCNPRTIHSELMRRIESRPDLNWMALVDGAFDFGSAKRLIRPDSIKLFDNGILSDVIEASPYIIQFLPNDIERISSEIIFLSKHRQDRPMLSFFSSKYSAVEVAERLRKFLNASSIDGSDFILRFADTRILEYLSNCLQRYHWSGITNLLEEWVYINRSGEIQDVRISKDEYIDTGVFQLSTSEFNGLVESAEPDCLINILHRDYPEIVPDECKDIFFNNVKRICEFSKMNGIENFHDILSMVIFGLVSTVEIEKDKDVAKLLSDAKWVPGELIDSLDEILKEPS